jgi:flagellin-like protein
MIKNLKESKDNVFMIVFVILKKLKGGNVIKMRRMNKKGISAVVATVLIILITVAAVTIIWAAVIPMIKDQTTGGTVCLDAVSQVSIETDGGFTCWDSSTNTVNVQVSRGAGDFNLDSIQFIVSTGGNTNSTEVPVTIESNSEDVFPVYHGAADAPTKVEIAPIVSVGQTTKKCEVSASAVLEPCS